MTIMLVCIALPCIAIPVLTFAIIYQHGTIAWSVKHCFGEFKSIPVRAQQIKNLILTTYPPAPPICLAFFW